jgi:hypothetical protein
MDRIHDMYIDIQPVNITIDVRYDEINFIKEICQQLKLEGDIIILKHFVSYRIGNIVLKLIDRHTINRDDGINTMKLTKYAEELGLGIKFLGGYSIIPTDGIYDPEFYLMVTEYKNPITQKFNLISFIEKIKNSPIKIHPDFCLKNMVIDETQNIYMIDWDYVIYNKIFELNHVTPRIAQQIMIDRFNGCLKNKPLNMTPTSKLVKGGKKRTRRYKKYKHPMLFKN